MSDSIKTTTIDSIANDLHMSKKTIYLLFRTKENLIVEAFRWKLDKMANYGSRVVKMEISVIDKFLKLLRIIQIELKEMTIEGLKGTYRYKDQMNDFLEAYLKGAVFDRFRVLIKCCEQEGFLKSKMDINSMMLMYWETLSSFINARPSGQLMETTLSRPFSEFLNVQLINFFRGFLNEAGIRQFDQALSKDPILQEYYA